MIDRLSGKHKLKHKYKKRFYALFGVSLESLWDFYTGFDIVRFDDEVIKSGDDAMRVCIRDKYGDEAVSMIKELIK